MDRGTCRGCKATVLWAVMESGKRNPLNPEPDAERGNIRVPDDYPLTKAKALGAELAAGQRAMGERLYLSHFASCPERGKFRKSERKAKALITTKRTRPESSDRVRRNADVRRSARASLGSPPDDEP